jgi:hypothetical protein
MKKLVQWVLLLLAVGFAIPRFAWSASPCDGVDRGLTDKSKAEWAPVIAKQLHAQKVDVLQSFRFEDWSIIYVDTHESDNAFLFYSHGPLRSHYVTVWGGAAMKDEEQSIKVWALKNAPGISQKLAGCFAWYVTNARTQ